MIARSVAVKSRSCPEVRAKHHRPDDITPEVNFRDGNPEHLLKSLHTTVTIYDDKDTVGSLWTILIGTEAREGRWSC